ncbi:MAG: hypothetical protein K2I42_04640, partial [Anaeroplasmataceae bacterium]|nr:hypothetical protein [Anaeroplasmataceae bacterium]
EKVVLIENEFGEVSVDTDFLSEAKIDIKELSQGCICCSLFGDFSKSLNEVVEKFHPERIIIEPSGVGKLSDIIHAVCEAGLESHLNSLICMVDASKAKLYSKNFGEFFIDQIKAAHTIVLSRTEKVNESKIAEALEIIRKHNQEAVVITTPIQNLQDENLLDAYEGIEDDFMKELIHSLEEHHHEHEEECSCEHHHHEHEEGCGCEHHHHEHEEGCGCGHHHHHADEIFTSVGIETVKKYNMEHLSKVLDEISNGEHGMIVRAKGVVCDLNNQWYQFNLTPDEVVVEMCNPCPIGKICVIGSQIDKDKIKNLF